MCQVRVSDADLSLAPSHSTPSLFRFSFSNNSVQATLGYTTGGHANSLTDRRVRWGQLEANLVPWHKRRKWAVVTRYGPEEAESAGSRMTGRRLSAVFRHRAGELKVRDLGFLIDTSAGVPLHVSDLENMAYPKLTSILDCFAVLLFLAAIQTIRDYRRRGGLPYPPGPRPLPVIGNVFDIPKHSSWLAYSKFSKLHGTTPSSPDLPLLTSRTGDILSFRLFGQVIIVLNTAKAAKDLLEKRGAIYSDRPVFPLYEMCVINFCTKGVLTHDN